MNPQNNVSGSLETAAWALEAGCLQLEAASQAIYLSYGQYFWYVIIYSVYTNLAPPSIWLLNPEY